MSLWYCGQCFQISAVKCNVGRGACLLAGFHICTSVPPFPKKFRLNRSFVFSMAVLGVGYMLFFRPVAALDEQAHYISAYRMSKSFPLLESAHIRTALLCAWQTAFLRHILPSGIMSPADFASWPEILVLFIRIPRLSAIMRGVRRLSMRRSAIRLRAGHSGRTTAPSGAVPVFYGGAHVILRLISWAITARSSEHRCGKACFLQFPCFL